MWFKSPASRDRFIAGEKKHAAKCEKWHIIREYGDIKLMQWRRAVGYEASWECFACGATAMGKFGEAHHRTADETKKYDEHNGAWLCTRCHSAVHHKNVYADYVAARPDLKEAIDDLHNIYYKSAEPIKQEGMKNEKTIGS